MDQKRAKSLVKCFETETAGDIWHILGVSAEHQSAHIMGLRVERVDGDPLAIRVVP